MSMRAWVLQCQNWREDTYFASEGEDHLAFPLATGLPFTNQRKTWFVCYSDYINAQHRPIVLAARGSLFWGRPTGHPCVLRPSVNTYFAWCDISSASGSVPVKLATNKITFKRTWSLSNAVCFKYVKYLTTNTAKVGHVTPSRPPLT